MAGGKGKGDDLDLTPQAGARENLLPKSGDPLLARLDIALLLLERGVEALEKIETTVDDYIYGEDVDGGSGDPIPGGQ